MLSKCVTFYAISSSFFDVSLKIIEKAYNVGERCLLLCDNEDEIRLMDSKLWIFSRLAFIPHGSRLSISPNQTSFCKIWISDKIEFINNPNILIHNGLNILNNSEILKFEKIMDIFNNELIDLAKERSNQYNQIGFSDQKLWIQTENNSWKKSNF